MSGEISVSPFGRMPSFFFGASAAAAAGVSVAVLLVQALTANRDDKQMAAVDRFINTPLSNITKARSSRIGVAPHAFVSFASS